MDAGAAIQRLVHPEWPPLRHVRRGWDHLTPAQRVEVEQRIETVWAAHEWGPHARDALLHFFTFLAQVETIAIEIPLRFLPHAKPEVRPLLERQLVDEVFHSMIFARLAHELALPSPQPPPPLQSAERLLDRIRAEPDLAVTATMLNLVAEGWIETVFKHALKWGVAPSVFKAVLADESRHVDEAARYMRGIDPKLAEGAVRRFESAMVEVASEPSVALAMLDLAGADAQQKLSWDLFKQHERRLRQAGLAPSPDWQRSQKAMERAARNTEAPLMPTAIEDTQWRRLARNVWQVPRDPTMQGDFDLPIGHVPKRLLTPVIIAALGRTLKAHPELNRIVARDRVWQLPHANIGVRVLLENDELATVIITEADRRSPRDIQRMLVDGIEQLRANRASVAGRPIPEQPPEIASLMPALPTMYAIGLSNAGKWGVISGAGSFSGWVSPSTDITVGLRRRIPRWRGLGYWPSWHVNIAAIQDHRVFDGRASSLMVTGIQAAFSPSAVRAILRTPDTLRSDEEIAAEARKLRADPMSVPSMQGLAAAGGFVWLPKYTPVALGGLALGAVAGVAGYLLYQAFNQVPLAGSEMAAAGAVPPQTGKTPPGKASAAPPGAQGKTKSVTKKPAARGGKR